MLSALKFYVAQHFGNPVVPYINTVFSSVQSLSPFVSLQIQLNVFFRNTVFSCQDLVKISQELNQFFINRLLEWQRLRHI